MSSSFLILFTNYCGKSLAHGRTTPLSYAKIFSGRLLVLTHLRGTMEYDKNTQYKWLCVRALLWCQSWQSIALPQQRRILCLFQMLLHLHPVEMHLHPDECFEEMSVINWVLCLRATKVLENNKAKNGIWFWPSLDVKMQYLGWV